MNTTFAGVGCTVGLAILLASTLAVPAKADVSEGAAEMAAELIGDADAVYKTTFVMQCSESTWKQLVDRPALLGRLWNAYGFMPTYQVEMRHDTVHVEDSTGLVGDAVTAELGAGRRQYLINGELDHWAVPFFNEGTAVLTLDVQVKGEGVAGTAAVHLRANSGIGRVVLRAARPLLVKHVANRLDLNLQDAAKIFAAVEEDPETVADLLGGRAGEELRKVLR